MHLALIYHTLLVFFVVEVALHKAKIIYTITQTTARKSIAKPCNNRNPTPLAVIVRKLTFAN